MEAESPRLGSSICLTAGEGLGVGGVTMVGVCHQRQKMKQVSCWTSFSHGDFPLRNPTDILRSHKNSHQMAMTHDLITLYSVVLLKGPSAFQFYHTDDKAHDLLGDKSHPNHSTTHFKNTVFGSNGKMAHNHEDLSPTPSTHVKVVTRGDRKISGACWPARLVGSRIREDPA